MSDPSSRPPCPWSLRVEAGLALVRARLLVRAVGFRAAVAACATPSCRLCARSAPVAALVAVTRSWGRGTCLDRSLALLWMLRRRGLPAGLRLGAGRVAGDIAAHAWIELDGRVIGDAPDVARRWAAFDGRSLDQVAAPRR